MEKDSDELDALVEYLFRHGWSIKRFAEEAKHPYTPVYYSIKKFYRSDREPRGPRARWVWRDFQALLDRLKRLDAEAQNDGVVV